MSTSTKAEILSLYRGFLRIIENWPNDLLRPNRNLKQVLHLRVTEGFRQNIVVKDQNIYNDLVLHAEKELNALRRLEENEFKEKYPLSDKMYTPAANPKYYSGLVVALDKAAKQKQIDDSTPPSWWRRILGLGHYKEL
ncbi:12150_t:CDS:2 [Funneliformis caledonium]|uniref:12150_t:CDS:1 n=2 Tax=Funneliformis TaxID=1117308 RepID=A0A9N8VBJ9_9GLOM|nr:12150_t:CDS:2 [Funneliformis caledonium]CAG8451968.1 5276_t:CDS:2 [Funneliformis mosseae]